MSRLFIGPRLLPPRSPWSPASPPPPPAPPAPTSSAGTWALTQFVAPAFPVRGSRLSCSPGARTLSAGAAAPDSECPFRSQLPRDLPAIPRDRPPELRTSETHHATSPVRMEFAHLLQTQQT